MHRSLRIARPLLAFVSSAPAWSSRVLPHYLATIAIGGPLLAQGYGKFAADTCRVPDLDGNGRDELAITDSERRTVWIVDPRTGDVVRRITDTDAGGRELPGEHLWGWSVESFSSSSRDLVAVRAGYADRDGVPEQKLVDPATGQVVGDFHHGVLRATTLPGVSPVLAIEPTRALGPEGEAGDHGREDTEYETAFRLLAPDTLCPTIELRLGGWINVGACAPGDLDGDGHADLLALERVTRGSRAGEDLELRAFAGSDGAILYMRSLCVADLHPGRVAIVPTGDIDGDDRGDCALRARLPEHSLLVFVSGAGGEELHRVEVKRRTNLSAIGDVDADGVRDVALADIDLSANSFPDQRNTIWVHSIRTGRCLYAVETPFDFMAGPEPSTAADAFGSVIVDLGDVDGDGVDGFAASANNPLCYDGEFVAVVSGRTEMFVKLLLGKDYRTR